MAIQQKLVTSDELYSMPEDGYHYELRRGELIRMVPPGFEHGELATRLGAPLVAHVRANHLGIVITSEVGFKLAAHPDTVRAPDIAFVSRDRVKPGESRVGYWEGAPDLAAEIVSPNDTAQELREKVAEYLAAGARLVWVVYPRTKSVTVYRGNGTVDERTEGQMLDGEDVVPGFSVPVADIFAAW